MTKQYLHTKRQRQIVKSRILERMTLLVLFFPFLLSCNTSWNSLSQFKDHPSTRLLVPDAKLKPGGYFSSVDWSTPSMLTLLASVELVQTPVYVSDVHTGSLILVQRKGEDVWSSTPKLSSDGMYLAYQSIWGPLGIYIATPDKQFELKDEVPVLDIMKISSLDWSHDNQQLAILTITGDGLTLYVYDRPTKNIQKLFDYQEQDIYDIGRLEWSPDGSKLAFSLKYETKEKGDFHFQSDVFIYYVSENRLIRLTSSPNIDEAYPSWFSNGNILIYTSTKEDDAESLESRLVFSAKDGKCTKIVPGLQGITSPSWSPDGNQLAFISDDGVEIMDVAHVIPPEFLSVSGLCN